MVGFERSELALAAASLPCWPPDVTLAVPAIFDRAARGEATGDELSVRRKNGELFPAQISLSRFVDGGTQYVVATLRDISEQKSREASQHSAAQRWRAMAENPYDFVTIVDENFTYVYVNHTAPGIRKEDLLGKRSPLDFIEPAYVGVMRDALTKAFGGATTSCEVYSDKLSQWFLTIVTPIFVDERVTAVSLLTRNIDQAKRAEQARRDSEHRLELALAGGDVGMFDLDVETGTVFCSPRLFEMLGYQHSQQTTISGALDTFREMVHPDDTERVFKSMARALSSGELYDEEYRLLRRDGTHGWFHGRGRSFDVAGRTRFSGFATDITARKRAEEERAELEAQLRNVQKLDTLGRLAAGLAHDLNNLLVPILGNAQILATHMSPTGAMRSGLDDIVRAATQARELVARILVFGRQSEEVETPVHVSDVVREAIRFLQGSLPPNVEVAVVVDEECPGVLGRPAQIQQAVMNLCTNALQALSTSGGRMSVAVERFLVDEAFARRHSLALGPAVRVVVEDNGPGMTPEILERAFEPFYTTKPLGRGSGLGLSIVHGIVGKHRGTVLASSQPGAGARFEIYLPARPANVAPIVPVESEAPPSDKKLRVLCVDDEPAVLRVLAQVLESAGHAVTTVTSPGEALRALQAHPADFDLVITDQTMPQLTGIELAAQMYAIRREMPVILLSGYTETEWVKAATPNVRSFVRKPFDARELAKAVQRVPS
jgi:two-component system cell cycle sensor histidine kinase/response regulator CckA